MNFLARRSADKSIHCKRQDGVPLGWLVYLTTFAAFACFQLLLAAVPIYTAQQTGRPADAGYLTAVLLTAAILGQVVGPRLMGRISGRDVMATGVALMGLSCVLGFLLGTEYSAIMVSQSARGLGFGLASVASAAVIVADSNAASRGRSMARYTLATAIPGIFMAPAGMELVARVSPAILYGFGGFLCLLGLNCAPLHAGALTRRSPTQGSILSLSGRVWFYALSFSFVSGSWVIFLSYVPLFLLDRGFTFASGMVLVVTSIRAVGRWMGAALATLGLASLLWSSLLVGLLGAVLFAVGGDGVSLWLGCVLYGAGVGVFHSSVYLIMLSVSSPNHQYNIGMVWNVAIELGGVCGTLLVAGFVTRFGSVAAVSALPLCLACAFLSILLLHIIVLRTGALGKAV